MIDTSLLPVTLLGQWWIYYCIYQFTCTIISIKCFLNQHFWHESALFHSYQHNMNTFTKPSFLVSYLMPRLSIVFLLTNFYWFIGTKFEMFSFFPTSISITNTTGFKSSGNIQLLPKLSLPPCWTMRLSSLPCTIHNTKQWQRLHQWMLLMQTILIYIYSY